MRESKMDCFHRTVAARVNIQAIYGRKGIG